MRGGARVTEGDGPPGAMPDVRDLSLPALRGLMGEMGEPAYRADQVWSFLYARGHVRFEEMHTLTKALRATLAARFRISALPVLEVTRARDGTEKFLFGLEDGRAVEAVLIPDGRRLTLCVSSQVGCAYACRFCLTGFRGFARNLQPSEIVGQYLVAAAHAGEGARITNMVFMGQGEPLANLDNVITAIDILTEPTGLSVSPRRITVSTVGLLPQMRELLARTKVELAVSLHATTEATRTDLVPSNRRYGLHALLATCRELPIAKRSRITYEYTMLAGVNDSDEDRRRLAKLLRGTRCTINLIPFNPFPGGEFRSSPIDRIERFAEALRSDGYAVMIRRTRGADVFAACGMLGRTQPEINS
ncbi:MAG: 23S rRNA (adenine(2503)-C(2))-methyltransferase RlmN [Deltaproteobacteria bacterium]|nr:23S rRNA (adenine(2503)-C(2))-methyltransferase RlmN [Deltaproteobacteria bacterium]